MAEPSAWAMERARAVGKPVYDPGYYLPNGRAATLVDVATALDTAREVGFIAGAKAMRTEATLTAARRGDNWTSAAIIRIDPATLPREDEP